LPSGFLSSSAVALSAWAALAAIAGALAGLRLAGLRRGARGVAPFSGGVLLGVSLFAVLPELAREIGWGLGVALFAAGYGVLFAVNRTVYPVCPACSHDHDHDGCASALHGFAAPLAAAAAVHSLLDGWSIATAEWGTADLRLAVPLSVALHKVPEGVALGAILRASMASRPMVFIACVSVESVTVFGALAEEWAAARLGSAWIWYPMALAGGFFCFLGFHAVHGEWRRRGRPQPVMAGIAGMAGAAAFQQGLRAFLR
jgi:zinc transporter ZupT